MHFQGHIEEYDIFMRVPDFKEPLYEQLAHF